MVTFRDIQELVADYGIDTRALKASEPSVLFGVLQRPAIVRLRRVVAGLDIGHYVLVLPEGLDLIVLDGALPIAVVPRQVAHRDARLSMATGEVVEVVSKDTDNADTIKVSFPLREVNLGTIPFNSGDVRVRVPVVNRSNKPLSVSGKTTCCSCFKEIEGSNVVGPRSKGEIVVILRRDRLAPGPNRRQVVLSTNDGGLPEVSVTAVFEISHLAAHRTVRMTPSMLDLGRRSLDSPVRQVVRVDLPTDDNSVAAPEITVHDPGPWGVTVRSVTKSGPAKNQFWVYEMEFEHKKLTSPATWEHRIRFVIAGGSFLEFPVSVQWVDG